MSEPASESLLRRTKRATFDQLFAEGAEALADGSYGIQVVPAEGDQRWGVSALLRPDSRAAVSVEALTCEAVAIAGDGHWLTGAVGNSHLTMRALEYPRDDIGDDDPRVARYADALRAASVGVRPLTFEVTGLTLTRLSVMACALPVDEAADRLSAAYAQALGPDAWLEKEFHREIWYLNLVHFAAAIRDPHRLIRWVAERRRVAPIRLRVTELEIATWRFTGTGMTPRRLAATVLG
ncbi:hypothetical protein [Catenulispora rubra]|uniref:hypothetical protein n=1 Tax=Catenulispora rubra TaxID=280293 RepID=UPI0018927581|nr:hypothetical protein [Catenulispora rubra]